MKAKLNYRTKRILILSAIIIALLAVASASVTYFLKGNNKAQAVTGNDIENQNSSVVSTTEEIDASNNQENTGMTKIFQKIKNNLEIKNTKDKNSEQNIIDEENSSASSKPTIQPKRTKKLPNPCCQKN